MHNAFWRAGVVFAALFMLVTTSPLALARHSVRDALFDKTSDDARHVTQARRRGGASDPGAGVVRASWYGGGERLNAHTASGERFNPAARTAAHRTLPLGTRARVVNLVNGRETLVTINDRGPALWTGRALDLSRQAAVDLGMIQGGETRVKMEIIR
ncbi:septal ring lytic transglycosylase RlpA family protein [Methylocystis sp. ATCC 49242]|uniref:septal ring lytic transglycosylase RlpA family protein n=1 Tax=Methylocystis sp. ATCC 49242 TaxID=622637 RepID=UPI0001F884B8|nr:septal ring lytic transglycosylase RlpA family protein [Methylocystis sp. ATCC 49242]